MLCSYVCLKILLHSFDFAVIAVDLKQTVQVDKDLQIRAYYAGHVKWFEIYSFQNWLVIFY